MPQGDAIDRLVQELKKTAAAPRTQIQVLDQRGSLYLATDWVPMSTGTVWFNRLLVSFPPRGGWQLVQVERPDHKVGSP